MAEAAPITAAQLITFVSTVLYKTIAAPNARNALLSALEAAGIDSSACVAAVLEAEKASGQAVAQQTSHGEPEKKSKPGRKSKGGANAEGDEEEKAKRKRAPSAMNVYMSYMFDVASKDPDNPAYKPAEPVDANGKPVKMPNVKFCGECWKAMSEADKARFNELIQPFLTARGEALLQNEGGAHQGKTIDELNVFLKEHNLEKEMRAIYNRSVEAGVGINPGKTQKTAGGSAAPASPAPSTKAAQANGTAEKRKADKPAKEAQAKKVKSSQEVPKSNEDLTMSAKKAKKEEKKRAKEEAARKAAEEEQRRKAEELKRKQQQQANDESEDIGDSEDEEDESDDE